MAKKKNKADRPARSEAGQRPWRDISTLAGGPGQKWTLPASIFLVVVLLAVSAWILFAPRMNMQPAAEPSGTSAASTPAPSANTSADADGTGTAEEAGVCAPTPVDAGATSAPADLSWAVEYGNSWPVSASVGPLRQVDGLGQCFARSPVGAALAAVNIMQSLRAMDTDTATRILSTQFVQNEGAQALTSATVKIYAKQPPQGRQWARTMGYKVLSFGENKARVLLVENWPQRAQYTGYAVTVEWVSGDWKIALEDDGKTSPDGDITVSPDGYTPWEKAP